ncbi:NAD kinase 2 [Microlunatus endophyticus]|uniref:NAD kinase n=1 Tax=Microlunatus endophyticus TaxID=1716077 RepID=A0A917S0W4_9ACTN|nr:NAD kinase 2 [Microlunatus endophyticus]
MGASAYAVRVIAEADQTSHAGGQPGVVRRVAVLTHTGRDEAIKAALRLINGLWADGIVCVLPTADIANLGLKAGQPGIEVLPEADPVVGLGGTAVGIELIVVLGGDGTILRGAEWVMAADIPLLGVNLGHVGFLAEAESSEIDLIVETVVNRSYRVEERSTIDVRILRGEHQLWSSFAINEVTIEKAARERVLELMVEIDGRPLSRWSCDGVLVSTPTGSTAYAFSAGGPVIWPGVDAMQVVPLSAHALFARPMVLSPKSRVLIEMLPGMAPEAVVWCDGRRSTILRQGMRVEVVQGKHRLRLARLSEAPFTDRLVHKFGLRVEGWRGAAQLRHEAARAAALRDGTPADGSGPATDRGDA